MPAAVLVDGVQDPDLTPTAVEVVERIGEPTTFVLVFDLAIEDGDLPLLGEARLDPGVRIRVVVEAGDDRACLVSGEVTAHRARLVHGGEGSVLEVRGSDALVVMDREDRAEVWAGSTDAKAVTAIAARHGFLPDVAATPAVHATHPLVQRDTDLQFARRLARRNGYLLWLSAEELGPETLHFRAPPTDGLPAATVAINVDGNVTDALELWSEAERPTAVATAGVDPLQLGRLDGAVTRSSRRILGGRGLADIQKEPRSLHLPAVGDDAADLRQRADGVADEAAFFAGARFATTVDRVGGLLRAHTVTDLGGVGTRYDGTWLVTAVRHRIHAAGHDLDVELARNGWNP